MKVKFIQAKNGDCIHIRFLADHHYRNILIDGGTSQTYEFKNGKGRLEPGELQLLVNTIKERNEKIDLLVLTHVDDDHIAGMLKWFSKDATAHQMIEKVWFNSGRLINQHFGDAEVAENLLDLHVIKPLNSNTSIRQGIKFENYISDHQIWEKKLILAKEEIAEIGLRFRILSPNIEKLQVLRKKWEKETITSDTSKKKTDYDLSLKEHVKNDIFIEDTAPHNGSSIAFLLSFLGNDFLFLADAHPTVIMDSLRHFGYSSEKPVHAALVKISHHGSKANMCRELFGMIKADHFIISTNGEQHSHPNKQLLARLIDFYPHSTISFNYPQLIKLVFSPVDYLDYPNCKIQSCQNLEFTYDN